jgi:hypothetical protein
VVFFVVVVGCGATEFKKVKKIIKSRRTMLEKHRYIHLYG